MAIYVASAFSLGMLNQGESVIRVKEISTQDAKTLVSSGAESVVGHQGAADAISLLLGTQVPVDRKAVKLSAGDRVVVYQLQGRLPEGAVLSLEEVQRIPHKWYLVTVEE